MHEESDHDEDFYEERDFYTLIKSHKVFETPTLTEEIPPGFTAVTIPLNGRINATLDWKRACQTADTLQKKGFKLLFDLDLGLFHHLDHPLDSKTQFATLRLAIQEFQKQIAVEFKDTLLGVIVARTSLLGHEDTLFSQTLKQQFDEWLQERECANSEEAKALFWHDVSIDYLELLTEDLQEHVTPILLVDCQDSTALPLLFARLTYKKPTSRIKIALKNPLFEQNVPVWQEGKGSCGYIGQDLTKYKESQNDTHIGVVLPHPLCPEDEKEAFSGLQETLVSLIKQKKTFKIISEEFLTSEWEDLDTLIVTPFVQNRSVRKLKGFEAAGGQIILTSIN